MKATTPPTSTNCLSTFAIRREQIATTFSAAPSPAFITLRLASHTQFNGRSRAFGDVDGTWTVGVSYLSARHHWRPLRPHNTAATERTIHLTVREPAPARWGELGAGLSSDPVVGVNRDGRMEVFAIREGCLLAHFPDTTEQRVGWMGAGPRRQLAARARQCLSKRLRWFAMRSSTSRCSFAGATTRSGTCTRHRTSATAGRTGRTEADQ